MKRVPNQPDEDGMLPEYDFRGAARGKYAGRFAEGSRVVVLDPDVAAVFPDAESVNQALRLLIKVARQSAAAARP